MNGESLVKRYVDGFLDFAAETIGFDKGVEELVLFKGILRDNPDLRYFLENPAIQRDEKYQLLEKALARYLSQEVIYFLKLLIRKDRINEFSDIAEYARIKHAHGGEVDALLKVSYPLDTHLLQAIKDTAEKKLRKKLHIYVDIDPALLGGVRLSVGNIIFDGSVKKRLEDLKAKLLAVRMA